MASILDFLGTHKGVEYISLAVKETSESREKVTAAFAMVLTFLIAALKRNTASSEGLQQLNRALEENTGGEEFLKEINNLNSFKEIKTGGITLNEILGREKEEVLTTTGSISQIEKSSVEIIARMAVSLVFNILSVQKHKEQINPPDIATLLNSMMGSSSKYDASLIETFLEKREDGSIIKDVEGLVLGSDENGKKDGGILGGMLGGK